MNTTAFTQRIGNPIGVVILSLFAVTASAQPPDWSPQRSNPLRTASEQDELDSKRVVWPEPVRQAQYLESPMESAVDSTMDLGAPYYGDSVMQPYVDTNAYAPPTPTHQVIRAPQPIASGNHSHLGNPHNTARPPNHPLHPGYRLHHQVQPIAATIPDARQRDSWKTPYSYGYFGASATRQWSTHTGYRDKYTEWRLR